MSAFTLLVCWRTVRDVLSFYELSSVMPCPLVGGGVPSRLEGRGLGLGMYRVIRTKFDRIEDFTCFMVATMA